MLLVRFPQKDTFKLGSFRNNGLRLGWWIESFWLRFVLFVSRNFLGCALAYFSSPCLPLTVPDLGDSGLG